MGEEGRDIHCSTAQQNGRDLSECCGSLSQLFRYYREVTAKKCQVIITDYYYYYYYTIWMSLVTSLFFPVLLLNQR